MVVNYKFSDVRRHLASSSVVAEQEDLTAPIKLCKDEVLAAFKGAAFVTLCAVIDELCFNKLSIQCFSITNLVTLGGMM